QNRHDRFEPCDLDPRCNTLRHRIGRRRPDVDHIRTARRELARMSDRSLRLEIFACVGERVFGDIENAEELSLSVHWTEEGVRGRMSGRVRPSLMASNSAMSSTSGFAPLLPAAFRALATASMATFVLPLSDSTTAFARQ